MVTHSILSYEECFSPGLSRLRHTLELLCRPAELPEVSETFQGRIHVVTIHKVITKTFYLTPAQFGRPLLPRRQLSGLATTVCGSE